MKRHTTIIANHKMNGNRNSIKKWNETLHNNLKAMPENINIIVCPPAIYIPYLNSLKPSLFKIGAQDCHAQQNGAFTGNIAAAMLKECGADYAIVGHSEWRENYEKNKKSYDHENECDVEVNDRAKAAIGAGLVPIICVGEDAYAREQNQAEATVRAQLHFAVSKTPGNAKIIIAYEPVWAIGSGLLPSPSQIQNIHATLRDELANENPRLAENTPIIYGGSANAENAESILNINEVDGLLVGGASLNADEFARIIRAA